MSNRFDYQEYDGSEESLAYSVFDRQLGTIAHCANRETAELLVAALREQKQAPGYLSEWYNDLACI